MYGTAKIVVSETCNVMELLLLTLLLVKHTVADFFLQRSFMFKDKHVYLAKGGLTHAGIHGILSALVLIPFVNISMAIVLSLIDTIIHYHTDFFKSVWNVKTKATPNENRYWYAFGLDQLVHMLTYVGIVFFIFKG